VGFREQVISSGADQDGVHVNGGSSTDIAWGLKEILCDSERAKRWGENGRKRVLQYFTWRKAAEQTLQIYEMLQHPQEQTEFKIADMMDKLTRT
jgi:glycosyltransferase involved in cell wall biosynthesis